MGPLVTCLEQLAALATIRGNPSDGAQLSGACQVVRSHRLASEDDLRRFLKASSSGTDIDIVARLRQISDLGGRALIERAIGDLPTDLRAIYESGAVTLKQLAAMHATLGITTVVDLLIETRRQTVGQVPGLDPSVEAAIAAALPQLRAHAARIPLGRAVAVAEPILGRLRGAAGVEWAEPVGSLRRGQDLVGDIELVASAVDPSDALDEIAALPDIESVRHRGARRIYFVINRAQVGVRCPTPAAAGATLLHLTGSPSHVARLHAFAADRKLSLDVDGLRSFDDRRIVASTEEAIYAALGLPFIPPELREGDDAIDAARLGQLPALVSRSDIRGDLHMHTYWSDGRDSIEAMVQECVALGYDYLAITDHSQHSAASRNLSIDDVARQAEEIADVRRRYPQITLLHGCEVDILPDGRLDFPDRVLQRFDIVLASMHQRAGQSSAELLRRCVGAMKHPLVSIVAHPMNRPGPEGRGYDLDVDRVFEAAVETGTVLEIDGAPSHLDLEASLARRAAKAGVTVSIDSDAHRSEMLGRHMTLGLLTARRGWIEPRHVLNTRSVAEVHDFLATKR